VRAEKTADFDGIPGSAQLLFEAGTGELNDVMASLRKDGDELVAVIGDSGSTISAGPGCTAEPSGDVACPISSNFTELTFKLADGSDRFSAAAVPLELCSICEFHVSGGPGDDQLTGSNDMDVLNGEAGNDSLDGRAGGFVLARGPIRPDLLSGGYGDDRLRGGAGPDVVDGGVGDDVLEGGTDDDFLDGGLGADVLTGGSDYEGDFVIYGTRREPIRVDFDGRRDDGARGERDLVGRDVEGVSGGRGDDRLMGNERANRLFGGDGDDLLVGRGGNDELQGWRGADRLYGGPGRDLIAGMWRVESPEHGRGRDLMVGGTGNDSLWAADGKPDRLLGGAGRDEAEIDVGVDRIASIERLVGASLAGRVAGRA
jgi:Ca2+-binding RTX toxin-like protein